VSVCCVCIHHKSEFYLNGWTNQAGFRQLLFTYPTLCYKEIWYSRLMVFPSRTRKSRLGKSIMLSTKLIDRRACWPHLRWLVHCCWIQIHVSRCNVVSPLLQFVADQLYNLFIQLCCSSQDFNLHRVVLSICVNRASGFPWQGVVCCSCLFSLLQIHDV